MAFANITATNTTATSRTRARSSARFRPSIKSIKWVADRACEFIENYRGDQPFALMVGFPGPHCPYDPPIEFADLYRPEDMPDSIPATDDSRLFRELVINMTKRPWNQVDYTDFQEHHKRKIRAHYAALVHQIDQGIGRIVAALNASRFRDDTVIIFASDHGDFLGDYDLIGKHLFYEPSIRVPLIVKLPRVSTQPDRLSHSSRSPM